MKSYLESATKQFSYYKMLGEKAIGQLRDDQPFIAPNAESNSIAVIVQHLHGNMLSRWTEFLTSDGEKEWRKRDEEFGVVIKNSGELMLLWNEGWACLFSALESLSENDLERTVFIRNQGHTVTDAINRQLCHYAYHVGQIVYVAKMLKNEGWTSLSIPRNKSASYNAKKFSEEKSMRHFTDEYLKKDDGNSGK